MSNFEQRAGICIRERESESRSDGRMDEGKLQLLERTARRVEAQPRFMAYLLLRYLELNGSDQVTLMARLGVDRAAFNRLALCWRPRAWRFDSDVARIAEVVGVDPTKLAQVIQVKYEAQDERRVD